jgi:hypothetical protein
MTSIKMYKELSWISMTEENFHHKKKLAPKHKMEISRLKFFNFKNIEAFRIKI